MGNTLWKQFLGVISVDRKLLPFQLVNDISSRSRNSTESKRTGDETLIHQTEGEEYER